MKYLMLSLLTFLLLANCATEQRDQKFVTSDVDHFWEAFDKIKSTEDSLEQVQYLQELFLDKASPGQQAMIQARNYTVEDYLGVIARYPLFWESIRKNTLRANEFASEIAAGIEKFEAHYPYLKPAKIYFTMGAFRSPGTTMDSMVLIGAEFAMGDLQTETKEFPENMDYAKDYYANNPIKDITFLNVHEYVHTQQKSGLNTGLLSQCLREGVAEFVTVKSIEQASPSASIIYGKEHDSEVRSQFEKEMFHEFYSYWLWNSRENKFGVRDLGYHIGYALAEKYYESIPDKKAAIKTLIELDYQDETAIFHFVDQINYFSAPIERLRQAYEKSHPKVVSIEPFSNGSQTVDPKTSKVTVNFSTAMDPTGRGFDYGPLGENNVLTVKNYIGFSKDGKSVSFEVDLKPNQRYQVMLTNRFANTDGVTMEPYLIDIKTAKR